MAQENDILRGWKEIEAYIRLTRKAILANGYPVRNERGRQKRRKSVYAIRSELDAFMAQGQNSRDLP